MANKTDIYKFKVESGDFINKNSNRIYKYEKTFYKNIDRNKYINKTNCNRGLENNDFNACNYENDMNTENFKAGFLLRSIVCLCMIAALVICKLSNTQESQEVFNQIGSNINENMSLDDVKNEFFDWMKKIME